MRQIKTDTIIKDRIKQTGNPDRPNTLADYIGQQYIKKALSKSIKAAKTLDKPLGHILFYGPPGLGKTTLANIIANEIGVNIRVINGGNLDKQGNIAAILSSLNAGDILFIDEIHRMPKYIEELLYSAMEDYRLDITIGEGPQTKIVSMDLEKFTLIGATTKTGILSKPLKDRFQMTFRMEYYSIPELSKIITKIAAAYDYRLSKKETELIASYCRQTPRIAIHLTKRVMDCAVVDQPGKLTVDYILSVLQDLGYHDNGLTDIDLKYLDYLKTVGKPVGLKVISAYLGETPESVEQDVESYLIRMNYICVTPRGRILIQKEKEEEND